MFASRLIVDDSLQVTPDGARFDIRLNWYRSLPLASLKILDVVIDGTAVSRERIRVTVDDATHTLDDVAELIDTWWYVLDPATVDVLLDAPLTHGDHHIEIRLGSRVPYIIIGPTIDDVYAVTDESAKTLTAA